MIQFLHHLFLILSAKTLRTKWHHQVMSIYATVQANSFFHESSNVINTQKDKSKIVIGDHSHIRGELLLFGHGGRIQIGEYCYIGEGTKIWSAKEIVIGNNVLIAHNVNIHDNISHPKDHLLRKEHYKKIITSGHPANGINLNEKKIIIKDNAWIGFNATILKGVTIGERAIVGACSVVTHDVPDDAIVVGNPAKKIIN